MHPLHRKYLFAFLSCGPLFALDYRLRGSDGALARVEDQDAFLKHARIREVALHCVAFWIEAEHYKFSVTHSEASHAPQLSAGRGGKRFESGLFEALAELRRLRGEMVARKLESMRGHVESSSSSSALESSLAYGVGPSSSRKTISAQDLGHSSARDRSSAFYNTEEFAMRTVGTDSSELLDLEPIFRIPSKRQDRAQDNLLQARIELREEVRDVADQLFEQYLGQDAKRSIKGLMPQLHGDKSGSYRALCSFEEEARSWSNRRRTLESSGRSKDQDVESTAYAINKEKSQVISAFRNSIKECYKALASLDADLEADSKWKEQGHKDQVTSDALPETQARMGAEFQNPQAVVWEHVIKIAFADFIDKCWCRRRRLFLYECSEFGLPFKVLMYHNLRDAVSIHFRNIPKNKARKLAASRAKDEERRLRGSGGGRGGTKKSPNDLPILAENTVQIAVAPME